MRNKTVSFDLLQNTVGTQEAAADNRAELKKMSVAVHFALRHELTDRQKCCVSLYYFEGRKIPEIARMLGLNKSTVSRHLKKGRAAMKRVVSYACFGRPGGPFS